MMIKKLAGQTAIYGVSSILSRLLNYLLTPLLTRLLTTSEYGAITDFYALIPFAMVLLTMGLETGYFRFAGEATADQRPRVFATAWGAVSAMGMLFGVLATLFMTPLAGVMGYAANPSYVVLVGWIVALDVITAIPYARLRQEGRAGLFVAIRTGSILLNIALVLGLYLALPRWMPSLYNPAYAPGYYLVANTITSLVTLLALYPSYRDTLPRVQFPLLRRMLTYSFPLLLSGVVGIANQFIDRQMIKYLMPADGAMEALGIYGAIAKLGVILLLFVQMYRYAAEPFFLSHFKKEEFKLANAEALNYFTMVSMVIFLLIMLYEDLFALLLGADFRVGLYILPIILLANIFSGMTLNLNFWYKQSGQTHFALYITLVGLAFTLALNIALVPSWGYEGAAWARLGCEAVMLVMSYLLNRRYYPTPYNLPRIAAYFLVAGACYGASLLLPEGASLGVKYTLNTLLFVLFGLYCLRIERINLPQLFNSILKR